MMGSTGRPNLFARKLFVDKAIQLPLVMYSLMIMSVGLMLSSMLAVAIPMLGLAGNSTLLSLFLLFGGAFILSVTAFLGFYLTNKVAGPIHRMKNHMTEIVEGKNPSPLVPRTGDYVNEELISVYNKLVEKINQPK